MIKCYEVSLQSKPMLYDIDDLMEKRQQTRDRINEIQEELKELEDWKAKIVMNKKLEKLLQDSKTAQELAVKTMKVLSKENIIISHIILDDNETMRKELIKSINQVSDYNERLLKILTRKYLENWNAL